MELFSILARAPGERVPGIDEARAMLRTLLADRFKLKVHRETKEMQVYALVAGTRGSRLNASSSSGHCSVHAALASGGRNNEEAFSNCPMGRLADRLTNLMGDGPVLDQTGLTGNYDFRLIAIPEYRSRSSSDLADISPSVAVQKFGLKLVPQKARVEILAVDHIEKPDEN
ncbi:MAG TPA: TIGR03435 family protein [Bryobacteraceae bacterium]